MLHRFLIFNESITEHRLEIAIVNDHIFEGTQQFFIELEATTDFVVIPRFNATIEIIDGKTSGIIELLMSHLLFTAYF